MPVVGVDHVGTPVDAALARGEARAHMGQQREADVVVRPIAAIAVAIKTAVPREERWAIHKPEGNIRAWQPRRDQGDIVKADHAPQCNRWAPLLGQRSGRWIGRHQQADIDPQCA
jgi:hypothetical protein